MTCFCPSTKGECQSANDCLLRGACRLIPNNGLGNLIASQPYSTNQEPAAPSLEQSAPISQEITGWQASEEDLANELHVHFQDVFGRWDWGEISHEGCRVWGAMFGEIPEYGSPIDCVISAVAAQSQRGVLAALAAATGENIDHIEAGLEYWLDNQDNLPSPVSFRRMINFGKKVYDE